MRDDILSYMVLHNIDCLFICKTNIVDPNFSVFLNTAWQKIIAPFDNGKHIFYTINNPDLEHRGSGSVFILTKKLHQHLQSTVILEHGRCIKLTLSFKNRKKINIYGIYLPPTKGNDNEHIKIAKFNQICKTLFEDINKEKSRDHLYETILGDFNINYKKYILGNNKSISYLDALQKIKNNKLELWMCYKVLKTMNFDNVALMFNKELEPTWFPPVNSNKIPTTIDYIWVSTNLKEITSHFHILRSSYSSDHAVLMFAFPHPNNDFINQKSFNKSRNQPHINNNRYNLSNLSSDDWITFNNKVNNHILTTADVHIVPTQKDITDYMDQLNKIIVEVLEEMNVKKQKITPKRNNLPLQLRQRYNQIHQLTSLQATLKEIIFFFSEEFTTEISSTIEQRRGLKNNFDRIWRRKSNWVIKLFHSYKINHSLILLNHTLNRSSSDKSPSTYNPLVAMPEPWRSVYSPKTDIKQVAIEKLSSPISMEELTTAIKSLPNNKAPGPSDP
ncbi:unnamed protein product [Rhizophagus irregularis]|nr:unnamed protein product [Rhizophagus irregularis]